MSLKLSRSHREISGETAITGSKSESNRLLILQALFPQIGIENLSNSDDTRVLQKALASNEEVVDIHHAGTAMRFLTAYFAQKEGREVVLTGSSRMQERPVKVLVDALTALGADIEYEKNEGYPPLRIRGKKLPGKKVKVQANISSQYISALMLIAAALPEGLEIELEGKITSVPYIKMTLGLMEQCGITGIFIGKSVKIEPAKKISERNITVESDWSSASYFYSIAALSKQCVVALTSYREDSLQADRVVADIYEKFGVVTSFIGDKILIRKKKVLSPKLLELDLSSSPDIAQTIAVTCLGLRVPCKLTGLHTLKIKETDRLLALKTEIEKLGGSVKIDDESLELKPAEELKNGIKVGTYHDHRMALAFAPLAVKLAIEIEDAGVVSKSYPEFWEDLEKLDFSVDH